MTVPDRKKATLIPILIYKIMENTTIWSDGWASYFTLKKHFYGWDWVNHKLAFKDPLTGVNTNRCEGMWQWLKATIPSGSRRRDIEEYVQVFNFKQWIKNHLYVEDLGFFGLLGRANPQVTFKDKGRHGDKVPNMVSAIKIVARNPLPEPPAPVRPVAVRGRGRPPTRRRGGRGLKRAHEV